MAPAQASKESSLIVAYDFGTTFTGVAHAWVDKGILETHKVCVVNNWPECNSKTFDQVPTTLAYSKLENPTESRASTPAHGGPKWGFQVGSEDRAIKWIKLLLETDDKLPSEVRQDIDSKLSAANKSVEDAISDFLREIYIHTESALARHYGAGASKRIKRQAVLTVPAMWSDDAKNLTKRAAIKAGLPDDLEVVSEPEAAALWALREIPWLGAKVGDNFVVCDAGGGTVDLITYQIVRLKPLIVKEAVRGVGGLFGGSCINRAWEGMVREKVGELAFAAFMMIHAEYWSLAEQFFDENIKRSFDPSGAPGKIYKVKCAYMPDRIEANIKNGNIIMTTEELRKLFDPVVAEIIDLCQGQVNSLKLKGQKMSAMILVGGFGQSKYLYEQINEAFPEIQVLQPSDAWSAISKGAVLWAAEGNKMVQSREARYHYGVAYLASYDKGKHEGFPTRWDDLFEEHLAENLFQTFIKRNQTVEMQKPISYPFSRRFGLHDDRIVTDELYISALDTEPRLVTDEAVRSIGTLETDLTQVPTRYFRKKTMSTGQTCHEVQYQLKMQLQSGGLKFWIEVEGNQFAAVTVNFE